MSYYVLTPASNLGNILSSESLSPASLYERRHYGFGSIDVLDDGAPGNLIRLHGECPYPQVGEDVAPMVLEVDESLVDAVSDGVGALWTPGTIRITPTKCRFLFFDKSDLDSAFNATRMSVEAKFANRYRSRARVTSAQKGTGPTLFDASAIDALPAINADGEDVEHYEMIDRLKGAIFGYCLGDDLSLAKDVRDDYVMYMSTVDELINSMTQHPISLLSGMKNILEGLLYKFAIRRELERLDRQGDYAFDLNERLSLVGNSSAIELSEDLRTDAFKLNTYRADLEERVRKAAGKKARSFGRPKVSDKGDKFYLALPDRDGKLAADLVNRMIFDDVLASTNRCLGYDFGLQCGKILRAILGESWDGSGERIYVNGLLPHLNESAEFEFEFNPGTEDERSFTALKTLAHLCERPDNKELDSFYRHLLIKCKVADFALPFSLWGAAFGFSSMPKTLCDAMSPKTETAARKLFEKALGALDR